ncbi:MAG: zf-HC2 domain-containing protein [Frankiaceae bacterium]|nr:zf-HC2 domain-containing protein [Frankiaceae bacterium]
MSCPGDLLSGLVDGELDHATRERVLSHLMSCPPCHQEVEGLRSLKTRLAWAGAETPVPSEELVARLLRMEVPGTSPAPRLRTGVPRPVSVRPSGRAPAASGPRRARRLRRRTVGGLVALGLSAAFVLGGPSSGGARVPIDPTTDQFVTDYVDATVEVPLREPLEATLVESRP